MPEELKELTLCQEALLELLFQPENRDALRTGDWSEVLIKAGYSSTTNKNTVLKSKLFRQRLDDLMVNYQTGMQFQAIMVQEDIMTGRNMSPLASVHLAAAKDVLDRSSKFVKKSEQKIDTDIASAVIIMPAKEEIEDNEV